MKRHPVERAFNLFALMGTTYLAVRIISGFLGQDM